MRVSGGKGFLIWGVFREFFGGVLATYLGGLRLGLVTFGGNLYFPPKGNSPKVGMGLKVKIKNVEL